MAMEGTLGMTTSHFLLDYLADQELLPGFVTGYGLIAADEQRHVAYGTEFLRRAVADDPAMGEVVKQRLYGLLPAMRDTLSPSGIDAAGILGISDSALAEHGLGALTRRLKLIGISL
jgi:ribonucleotide reductase beta subunit family protein with ferritin-like domain